jgi:hypothetical protein
MAMRTAASLIAVSGQTTSCRVSLVTSRSGWVTQVVQHIEDFGCQGNGLCPAPETGIVRVQTEAAK